MTAEHEPTTKSESRLQAAFLGTRLDLRDFEHRSPLILNPLTIRAGANGYAVLFRYGVVVLVDLTPDETSAFMESLAPYVTDRFDSRETETLTVVASPAQTERMDLDGTLRVHDLGLDRIQVVSHILAKSVVLAYYEEQVAGVFDQIEQWVAQMKERRMASAASRTLLNQIGDVLIVQTQTVGRVEVTEKPEITWDRPDLDRLYERLSLEYELRDRDRALTRKLEFISDTAQIYLDLLDAQKSLRLEWYIVILILVEIVLIVYDIFAH
jgi:uncharacterized Rmd1/YagE family protein